MNFKSILWVALCCLPAICLSQTAFTPTAENPASDPLFGQSNSTQKTVKVHKDQPNQFKVGINQFGYSSGSGVRGYSGGIAGSFERKLDTSWSVGVEVHAGFGSNNLTDWGTTGGALYGRYYLGKKQSIQKGRSGYDCSGTFVEARYEYAYYQRIKTDGDFLPRDQNAHYNSVGITVGRQWFIGKHFYIEAAGGVEYRVTGPLREKRTRGLAPHLNLNFGFRF